MPAIAEIQRPGRGRGRPPRHVRGLVLDRLLQRVIQAVIHRQIAVAVGLAFVEPAERADQFVIAAPQRQAGMGRQPADLLARLGAHIVQPGAVGRRIQIAGEHEVLPDQQPAFRTHLVKPVRFITAAAPDPQHVHMRRDRTVQQIGHRLGRGAGGQRIGGDPVRAAHEDFAPVDAEGEAVTDRISIGQQRDLAQADAHLPRLIADHHLQIIDRLRAMTGGPPQARMVDGGAQAHPVLAGP